MVIKTIVLNCWHTMGFQLWKVQAMIIGSWYHLCVYHKASPDIPELEMQKWHSSHLSCVNWPWKAEAFQDNTELLMQTNKWFTYNAKIKKKWLRLCFSLLLSFIFCRHASLSFALWHFSSCDTWANISSVKQYQICLGLLSVIFVPVCEHSRRISSSLSLVCVGGQMNERQSHKEWVFKKDVAQETV